MKKIILLALLALLIPTKTTATEQQPPPANSAEVPIIMYHLITENPKYIGKYGVTPKELASDLQYLKENNYTTVVMKDLIDFINHDTPLPEKPIVLTFDDGNFSDYQYLYPLLKEYNMKAVLAIIGKATDENTKLMEKYPTSRHPNMSWAQALELHESGLFEIQSHGYDMHGRSGSGEKRGEDLHTYHTRLYNDLNKLQNLCQEHLKYKPNTFVYPLGVIGKESRTVLEKLDMQASLSCQEGINVLRPGDVDSLFKMYRYNRPSDKPLQSILENAIKIHRKKS